MTIINSYHSPQFKYMIFHIFFATLSWHSFNHKYVLHVIKHGTIQNVILSCANPQCIYGRNPKIALTWTPKTGSYVNRSHTGSWEFVVLLFHTFVEVHSNTYPEECREAKAIKGNLEVLRIPADNLDDVVIKFGLFDLYTLR